ncbi:MAG: rane protein [Chthoniobacteraceae bacterium]|nr:rane protein [Chthoniobacteraceae bacterium]
MRPEADLLKAVPLFQFLDEHEREELASQLDVVQFAKDETIFNYGDPGDAIYVISSGEVEVFFKNDTGERIVLELASRGNFFGELSLLDNGTRSASVVAIKETEALRLGRADLEKFLHLHPEAAMDLLAAMGRRHRFTVEQLRHTATRNVNEEISDKRTLVQKSADWIAEFAGSITFLMIHVVFFGLWLGLNWIPIPGLPQFDPYPFGFLTLSVSLEAIFLSVFVLLSQNRQAAKDRVHADIEYDVNLKAELEIGHLHEKVDRLTCDVLMRLERLQGCISRNGDSLSNAGAPIAIPRKDVVSHS